MKALAYLQSTGLLGNATIYLGVLLSAGNAYIILKSRSREEAHNQTVRLSASYKESWEKAEREKTALAADLQKVSEERDTFRTGYTAVSGIIINSVLNLDSLQRERDALERECRELHARLTARNIEGTDNAKS